MEVEDTKTAGLHVKLFHMNGIIVGIATDIGPRILYVSSKKKPDLNLFGVLPETGTKTPSGFWRIYGGHRLWAAPEAKPRSYSMDDEPVQITISEDSVSILGNPEIENSIQKTITLRLLSENSIQVTHAIRNMGRWPVRLACWALSVMRKNGFAIMPLKPFRVDDEGLLPDRHVSLWPYMDLSDQRLKFAEDYIFVRQNPEAQKPLKIGAKASPTWTAYWVDGTAFVKEFSQEEGEYPDFGCNVEVYTNSDMLELETLGPLRTVNPAESLQHTEIWKIIDVGDLAPDAGDVDKKLNVLLSGWNNR